VIEGLQAAELVITQDAFLDTETNRYADILLPGALWAEAEGVMINSERNLTLMQKAVQAPGERRCPTGRSSPGWRAKWASPRLQLCLRSEVFEEIKHAWNPQTGYDIRGASHARLREQPLQWPCASNDIAEVRNPIRYLNDGVSQALKVE
jgi:sulfite reductase (NADPH) flavoprotein alpha-component